MLYKIGRLLVAAWFFLLTRRIVKGRDNVPVKGPLLVVANHLNNADPPLVGICLDRKARFMAKEELFRIPPMGYIFRSIGAFPVRRRHPGKDSLQEAEQALNDSLLVMFPESHRSKDAKMHSGLPGAAMLAVKCGVSVLPIGIAGTDKLKGPVWWLTRPEITVNIGKPFNLPVKNEKPTSEELTAYTTTIMKNIASLIPLKYRGKYE